jgi:Amt family ammonium transporter
MTIDIALNNVWILICATLVFLMHAGFACVEAGMTQSKNTANIIMKNFMTIAIGSLCYYIIGYSIMYGPSIGGIIGTPGFGISGGGADGVSLNVFWFFQAVFAATCATIVSGAVAERMKFAVYLGFCLVMCAVIYPVTGHWIWGGGWLSSLGFTDFAGSTAVHAIGGFSALVGAKLVGARNGKYPHRGTVKTIPGHSIPLGALGVLLLWFGWFGFNAGSGLNASSDIGLVAVNTILAGAAGALAAMGLSFLRQKHADVPLTLNGCLAGLVGITAGCASVQPWAAIVIGILSGVVMLFAVDLFDRRLKIDDPVGAISVHGITGAFGTICVGLFATDGGILYGGGMLLPVQILGVIACGSFAMLISFIYFSIVKRLIGLRVRKDEEIAGLDSTEHKVSAYNTTGMLDL